MIGMIALIIENKGNNIQIQEIRKESVDSFPTLKTSDRSTIHDKGHLERKIVNPLR